MLAQDQHIHAITRTCTHTGICARMQTHRLRFRLLIHKVFSKAVIYPIGLSLNAFEWDQSNYNLQSLMVKRKDEKRKPSVNKADSAFMWLCFWKPLWTRGVCVLFCAELNRLYLQGLNIYLVCSFPTSHGISGILWNLRRCRRIVWVSKGIVRIHCIRWLSAKLGWKPDCSHF